MRVLFLGGLREAELILFVADADGDGVDDILLDSSSCDISSIIFMTAVYCDSVGVILIGSQMAVRGSTN